MSEFSVCPNVFLRLKRTRTIFCCYCFENEVKGEQTVLLNAVFFGRIVKSLTGFQKEPSNQMNLVQGLKNVSC